MESFEVTLLPLAHCSSLMVTSPLWWLSLGHDSYCGFHSKGPADWIQMRLLCILALRKP